LLHSGHGYIIAVCTRCFLEGDRSVWTMFDFCSNSCDLLIRLLMWSCIIDEFDWRWALRPLTDRGQLLSNLLWSLQIDGFLSQFNHDCILNLIARCLIELVLDVYGENLTGVRTRIGSPQLTEYVGLALIFFLVICSLLLDYLHLLAVDFLCRSWTLQVLLIERRLIATWIQWLELPGLNHWAWLNYRNMV
jgi:hypothetical protein